MTWVPDEPETNPIGFTGAKKEVSPEDEKVPSEKEEAENILKDIASTVTALFRGEVDISELN
jgi:hypothetical protein